MEAWPPRGRALQGQFKRRLVQKCPIARPAPLTRCTTRAVLAGCEPPGTGSVHMQLRNTPWQQAPRLAVDMGNVGVIDAAAWRSLYLAADRTG
jgi:hypothetical protein